MPVPSRGPAVIPAGFARSALARCSVPRERGSVDDWTQPASPVPDHDHNRHRRPILIGSHRVARILGGERRVTVADRVARCSVPREVDSFRGRMPSTSPGTERMHCASVDGMFMSRRLAPLGQNRTYVASLGAGNAHVVRFTLRCSGLWALPLTLEGCMFTHPSRSVDMISMTSSTI